MSKANYYHNQPAKTLYHLTEHDYGDETFWHPKTNGIHITSWEPDTPRICFSLSVTGCFLALGNIATQYKNWHLYSTFGSYYQPTTLEVVDSEICKEVWRLEPTLLIKKHFFSYQEKELIQNNLYFTVGNSTSLKYQLKFKSRIEKHVRNILNDKP